MTVQSGQLSGGQDADDVAAKAARDLTEKGFSARVGVSGGAVVLGPFTARQLVWVLNEDQRRIRELTEQVRALREAALRPPY